MLTSGWGVGGRERTDCTALGARSPQGRVHVSGGVRWRGVAPTPHMPHLRHHPAPSPCTNHTATGICVPAPPAVWYEIYTLSRPGTWVAAATHPLLRAFQRKFAADSMAAMRREMLKP